MMYVNIGRTYYTIYSQFVYLKLAYKGWLVSLQQKKLAYYEGRIETLRANLNTL